MASTQITIPERAASPETPVSISPFVSSPSSSVTSLPSGASSPKYSQDEDHHDPHRLPEFTAEKIANPSSPILYLPPLLSSLPATYASLETKPVPNGPIATAARLPTIDPASLALHKALHAFQPLTAHYARTPYAEAFNWDSLELPEEYERDWYCVAFRSIRKAGSDSAPLYEADAKAHEEAVSNGGLIMYWYGKPDPETGVNLATCVWMSREHAVAANSRPHHIRAMRLAAQSYEMYDLERYTLRKARGETGLQVLSWAREGSGN